MHDALLPIAYDLWLLDVVFKFAFDLEKAISDSKSQLWKKIEIHSSCTLSELLDVPLGKRWQAFRPKPVFLCHDKFHRDRKICMDTLQAGSFLVLVVMIKSALLLRWNL